VAEQNIRLFLAVKAVLDMAADGVEMDVPNDHGVLTGANVRLDAFIQLFNLRLEELRKERRPWQSSETRLEKALKKLPAIEADRLRPSRGSLRQLKSKILSDAHSDEWLRTKVESLVCGWRQLQGTDEVIGLHHGASDWLSYCHPKRRLFYA
jgi:hypothetical protein